jgi:hypothetical protein
MPTSPFQNNSLTTENESQALDDWEDGGDDGSLFDFGTNQVRPLRSILCARCQLVVGNWFALHNNDAKFPHCENSFVLEASAREGCALCAQFLGSMDPMLLKVYREMQEETQDHGFINGGGIICIDYSTDWTEVHPALRKPCWRLKLSFPPKHLASARNEGLFVPSSIDELNFWVEMVPSLGHGRQRKDKI